MKSQTVQLVAQQSEKDGGGLVVVQQGTDALRSLGTKPVSVVAIAGLYRSGKSLLLNRFVRWLGFDGNFVVGNSTESCTRGIWATILTADQEEEEKRPKGLSAGPLILLDTEGLASVDQDETHDCKIFTLGLLLSSSFVYNSMGVIDEGAIDRLYMVGKLAQSVSKNNKIRFSLLWALRDFSLSLERFGGDADAYLEDALQDKKKRQSNRGEIRKIFPTRQCRCLVRPVTEESDLQRLDSLPRQGLRDEFLQQSEELFELILSKCAPKKLSGQILDGASLAEFLNSCVNSMRGDSVPDIKKTFEYVAEASFRRVQAQAEALYTERMLCDPGYPSSWLQVLQLHEKARSAAVALFSEPGVFESATKAEFVEGLNTRLQSKLESAVWPDVAARSTIQSEKRWTRTLRDLDQALEGQTQNDLAKRLAQLFQHGQDDPAEKEEDSLGPEWHKVFHLGLVRDLVLARLVPRLARQQSALAAIEVEKVRTEQLLSKSNGELEAARAQLVERDLSVARLEEQLAAAQGQLEEANERAERQAAACQTALGERDSERAAHDSSRSRLEEALAHAAKESSLKAEVQLQAEQDRMALSQSASDNQILRLELDEIISAAAKQQDDFDQELAGHSEKTAELHVELVLERVLHAVETKAAARDKNRLQEERAVLHEQLQHFHYQASAIPEWVQQEYFH